LQQENETAKQRKSRNLAESLASLLQWNRAATAIINPGRKYNGADSEADQERQEAHGNEARKEDLA
jgi:hypothetical protein